MGKILIGLGGLVIGGAIGAFLIGGAATVIGVGMCSTVEAAISEGLLTKAEVDQVLSRASAEIAAMSSDVALNGEIVGNSAACADIADSLPSASE